RRSSDLAAAAERRPSRQPLLHRADLLDGDVPLELERLAVLALPFLLVVLRQVAEHEDIGVIAFGLGHALLGDQFARGLQRERGLAQPAPPGEDPGVRQPRPGARGAPFAPWRLVARQRHRASSSQGASACTIRAWVCSALPPPPMRAKRSGSASAKRANAAATRA